MATDIEGYYNVGRAVANPTHADALAYQIVCNACKRFLMGQVREHDAYTFYTGFQIKVFIQQETYARLQELRGGNDPCGELFVNGQHLGNWSTAYRQGKLSCRLILTLSEPFRQKHAIIKRFAQLAVEPLPKDATWHECENGCGRPMSRPINGTWICDDCYEALHPEEYTMLF